MTLGITVSSTTATSATIAFTGRVGSSTIELQHCLVSDFKFCPAPIYSIADAASYTIPGLNQRGTYYLRGRVRSGGAVVGGWSQLVGFRTGAGTDQAVNPTGIVVGPAFIVHPEPVLSFSAPTGVAGFPPENLLRDSPVAFKATLSGGAVRLYFQVAAPIDTISLLNTNLPEGTTVQVVGGPTLANLVAGTSTTALGTYTFRASLNVPARPGYHGLFRLGATANNPWYMLLITPPAGLPGDMFYAEYLVPGLNRVTKNISTDSSETALDLGAVDRSRAGLADRQRGYKMRRFDLEISQLPETQHETLLRDLNMWLNDPILVVPNSIQGGFLHDRILYGTLSASKFSKPSSLRYNHPITIDSLI